jgi:hypothetical protein
MEKESILHLQDVQQALVYSKGVRQQDQVCFN